MKAQTQFFKSELYLNEKYLNSFYSSLTINGQTIYMISNDYVLRAFDKETGEEKWQQYIRYKTNQAPYLIGDTLLTAYAREDGNATAAFINAKTGEVIRQLPFEPVHTEPYLKRDIMYCTTIYNAGNILAYDIKKDTVAWSRFIAHGVDMQPVYLKNKIVANAEDTNWFELGYDNRLLGKCKNPAGFVEDITCVRNYRFLSHDEKEITDAFLKKMLNNDLALKKYTTSQHTLLVSPEEILILGKKLKKTGYIYIYPNGLTEDEDRKYSDYYEILKADDKQVWFIAHNMLIQQEFTKDEPVNTYNLAQWNPHQALLDGNNLWLISRNDGQLYGLKLD